MAKWYTPYFEVEVTDQTDYCVPMTKRIERMFEYPHAEHWTVLSNDSNSVFQVKTELIHVGNRWQYCIGWGWEHFKRSYDIKIGDTLRIYVIQNKQEFRVRTFRDGQEITGREAVQEEDGENNDEMKRWLRWWRFQTRVRMIMHRRTITLIWRTRVLITSRLALHNRTWT